MYLIGDKIMYRQDVCVVKDIRVNPYSHLECYVLSFLADDSLTVEVPVNAVGMLRSLISKEEIEDVIKKIPDVPVIKVVDTQLENVYKELLSSGNPLDLVKIIKTAYLRNQKRLENKKKIGEKDNNYLLRAEKCLFEEFGAVLGMSFEETKDYVMQEVDKIDNK